MTDLDIREALDRATRHLSPPPDLLDQVRHGGRRRVVHRRTVLGAGLAAVFGGSATGALQIAGRPAPPDEPTGFWLLDAPTRGDLAGDKQFQRRVRETWLRHQDGSEKFPPDATPPHVVWAGTTPAGPAAYLAQRAFMEDGTERRIEALAGFVQTTAAGLEVVDPRVSLNSRPDQRLVPAVVIGGSLDVLIVIDAGLAATYSTGFRYATDGRVERTFAPVPFAGGAAVLRVPSQQGRITVALRPDPADAPYVVDMVNAQYLKDASGLENATSYQERDLPGAATVWPKTRTQEQSAQDGEWHDKALAPYTDVGGYGKTSIARPWRIRGVTPDGRRLWVETLTVWDEPARVFAVIGRADATPRVAYGGLMRPGDPLDVSVRLPDRQGVVVAAADAVLRYRSGAGRWVRVEGDAALLPDGATEVEVTRRDGRPTRVSVR